MVWRKSSTFDLIEFRLLLQGRCDRKGGFGAGVGLARHGAHLTDFLRHRRGAVGRLLDVARDFASGRALLFDRRGNRGGDVGHFLDGGAELLDRLNRLAGRTLDRRDLARDLLGRLRRLGGELLTSLATIAKPRPASPARAASMVAFSASKLVWLAIA